MSPLPKPATRPWRTRAVVTCVILGIATLIAGLLTASQDDRSTVTSTRTDIVTDQTPSPTAPSAPPPLPTPPPPTATTSWSPPSQHWFDQPGRIALHIPSPLIDWNSHLASEREQRSTLSG